MRERQTITEHIARLESMRDLQIGERVRVRISGRTGTVVDGYQRHNGYMIEWDEPMFGVTRGRVNTHNLERE